MPHFMLAYSLGYNHEANKIGKGFILYFKPAVRGVSEGYVMGNL